VKRDETIRLRRTSAIVTGGAHGMGEGRGPGVSASHGAAVGVADVLDREGEAVLGGIRQAWRPGGASKARRLTEPRPIKTGRAERRQPTVAAHWPAPSDILVNNAASAAAQRSRPRTTRAGCSANPRGPTRPSSLWHEPRRQGYAQTGGGAMSNISSIMGNRPAAPGPSLATLPPPSKAAGAHYTKTAGGPLNGGPAGVGARQRRCTPGLPCPAMLE